MPRLRDHLPAAGVVLALYAVWVSGPVLFLLAMAQRGPSVEEQLVALGHLDLLEERDDQPVEYTIDAPFLLTVPVPVPVPVPEPEQQPVPEVAAPEPVGAPAPELAVAVAEAAPRLAAGGKGAGTGARAAGKARVVHPLKVRTKKNCDVPHPQIRPGEDGVIEIDRALVDEYTRNLESFMKLGYSRPYDEEGVHGWYISGFSCASPVAKAGFKRGDVLLAVNGKKTRSWVGVYFLYQKLKNKDEFEVDLVRKGEPLKLRFRVVPR